MDHYKVLGLSQNASKEEIKEAFRNLAMQFHPDKHSHSPKSVKDGATLRFKQASEAYEVLMDDRKRAHYNLHHHHNNNYKHATTGFNSNSNSNYSSYGYGFSKPNNYTYGDNLASKFEIALHFLNTRSFLLSLAFAGVLFGGTVVIDMSRDALWKRHNPGKSFEDAMESIEKKKKSVKDKL